MSKNEWIFTFTNGSPNGGHCVRLCGTYADTRKMMFNLFGDKWAFQYSADEWSKIVNEMHRKNWPVETEITINEAMLNLGRTL